MLVLGWTLFSVSSSILIIFPLLLPTSSLGPQSALYLTGGRQSAHLVQRIHMAVLKKQMARQGNSSTDRQEDLIATLHTSFFLLLFLLLSSILVSLCELVVFSWQNKGRQTAWTALLAQIKSVAARSRKKDDLNLEGPEAGTLEWEEPIRRKTSQEDMAEEKENTRM